MRRGSPTGGAEVLPSAVDVRDPEAVERVAAAAIERFGKLHVAVNNAGVVNGGYSWEIPLEEWHRVIDVDLWGVIHGIRSFVPRILASGEEGHVVNTASMAAVMALGRLGPYTVAKHGVLGLSDVLRAEFASLQAPVGVSVVMPGMIKTGMNPVGIVSVRHRGGQRRRRHPPRAQLRLHRRPQHRARSRIACWPSSRRATTSSAERCLCLGAAAAVPVTEIVAAALQRSVATDPRPRRSGDGGPTPSWSRPADAVVRGSLPR